MTIQDFYELLAATKLPVTYEVWRTDDVPPMPFITYRLANTNNFGADNKVQAVINHFEVELWTKDKEPQTEAVLEEALANMYWDKDESFIAAENCFYILYDVEVIHNEQQD